jgi:hypothetical protein
MSDVGAPSPRSADTAATTWSGSEMLVFGGLGDPGGRYDPRSDRWSELPATGAPTSRTQPGLAWDGSGLLVWGGVLPNGMPAADGARWDARQNAWHPLAMAGAPAARWGHTSVWTGRELLIWGGRDLDGPRADGAAYDPATDRWRSVAPAPLAARVSPAAVWTGSRLLVWGGQASEPTGLPLPQPTSRVVYFADGATYDPIADAWLPISSAGAPNGRQDFTPIWTGSHFIVWGGARTDGADVSPATRFDLDAAQWTELPTGGAPAQRHAHAAAWTGGELLIWGGLDGGDPRDDGARYVDDPVGGSSAPSRPGGDRSFSATGFSVDDDTIWEYFERHGASETFGYPISRPFTLLGCEVQVFQRAVAQRCGQQHVGLLNLLDPEIFPYTHVNGSVFPAPDQALKAQTPRPGDPDSAEAVVEFVRATAPDEIDGERVQFGMTYFDAMTLWGLPTSHPARDPSNPDFIYQRFQRGIMHHMTGGETSGILVADYLKAIMLGDRAAHYGANLPGDLRSQAESSPLFGQYCPGAPGWLCRPAELPGTDLTVAFERE